MLILSSYHLIFTELMLLIAFYTAVFAHLFAGDLELYTAV